MNILKNIDSETSYDSKITKKIIVICSDIVYFKIWRRQNLKNASGIYVK